MLPDSDYNRSSVSSIPTTEATPKSSTSENPYLSSATLNSSQKSVGSASEKQYHAHSAVMSSSPQKSNEHITPDELITNAHQKVDPEKVVLAGDNDFIDQIKFGLHDKSPCPV